MEKLTDWKFPLFIGILLSVLYVHYYSNRAFVELDIKVTQITWFKIYWAAPGKPFSEERMVRVRVRPEETHYRFFATGDTEEFREVGARFLQLPIRGVNSI